MNEFVSRLMEAAISIVVPKTFDLLNNVLEGTIPVFNGANVEFKPNTNVFCFENNGVYYEISFNLNTAIITVTATPMDRDNIIARCTVGIDGSFNETYYRMDADTKSRISSWFTRISEIDIAQLGINQDNVSKDTCDADAVEAEIVEALAAE